MFQLHSEMSSMCPVAASLRRPAAAPPVAVQRSATRDALGRCRKNHRADTPSAVDPASRNHAPNVGPVFTCDSLIADEHSASQHWIVVWLMWQMHSESTARVGHKLLASLNP